MRARKERATAHSALIQLRVQLAKQGRWSPGCTDHLLAALEFTEPRPWWRFW